MASIKQINGKNGELSFKITVSCGYTKDGKKISKSTTFRSESKSKSKAIREANDFAVLFEKQVKDGTAYIDGNHTTFTEFVNRWDQDVLQMRVKTEAMIERTRKEYLGALRRYAIPIIGHLKLSKIQGVHIDSIVHSMIRSGRSPKTIANVYHVINSIFAFAVRKKIIGESPCLSAEKIPQVKRKHELHTFTQEQANRFLNDALTMNVLHNHKETIRHTPSGDIIVSGYTEHRAVSLMFRTFFTIALYSGARRGELTALRWSDIDFEDMTISITRAVTSNSDVGLSIKDPKTDAGKRVIDLPEKCFTLLSELRQEQISNCIALGTAWCGMRGLKYDDNYIFTDMYGRLTHPDTFTKKFRDILISYNKSVSEDMQLPLIRLHDLRHNCASHLVANGIDIQTVADRLGHSKKSFTIDTYTHGINNRDRRASNALSELFEFNVAVAN